MTRIGLLATALAAMWGTCGIAFGGSKTAGSRNGADAAAKQAVNGVLSGERDGSVTNRARRLRATVRQSPQFAPAQWQSGRVMLDGEWTPIRTGIARLARDKMLAEYRAQRATTAKTIAGQLELAAWCQKRKLYAQQRAHLTAVLEINPNHAAARKALGFVRMGPFWISQRELQQRREEAKQAAEDLKRWGPKVISIRNALTSGSRLRYNQGLKRLKAIDDPAAIPAIELGLAYENPRVAIETIDYLGQKSSKESTLALASQGMFSPWKTLRKRAAEKLKGRNFEHFVPQVLAMTSTPLQSQQVLYNDRWGSLCYRHVFGRETPDHKTLGFIGFDRRPIGILAVLARGGNGELVRVENEYLRANYDIQVLPSARLFSLQQEYKVEDRKNTIAEVNRRSCQLLSVATCNTLANDPQAWWRWWDSYTEGTKYSQSESKPQICYTVYDVCYLPIPYYRYMSCLVAGTPVWTDRGPVAIDKVQIGDLVLSQNVETGELAFKPVLKTTVRPKRSLIALEIGPRTIGMTGGHPFWVSGKGWMKARDIKPGMTIRDVTGTTTVRPAGSAKAAPTYNLIVADFHTYFVGDTKVLSHDNTPIEPTNVVVPGLRRTR